MKLRTKQSKKERKEIEIIEELQRFLEFYIENEEEFRKNLKDCLCGDQILSEEAFARDVNLALLIRERNNGYLFYCKKIVEMIDYIKNRYPSFQTVKKKR
jgi:hypothetical protein